MQESYNELGGVRAKGPVRQRTLKEMQESSNGLGGVIAKDQSAEDP
jgi:hypothetical protein